MPKPRFSGGSVIDALVVEPDAAVRQRQQARHAIERRGFAAARRPQQRDELAALYRERQLVQGIGATKLAAHAVKAQLPELIFVRGMHRDALVYRHRKPFFLLDSHRYLKRYRCMLSRSMTRLTCLLRCRFPGPTA